MTPTRVLIAGCGDVGNALGRLLLADGCTVWGLRRNVARLAEGLQPLALDLCDLRGASLPRDVNAVVFTAAADAGSDEAYRRAYVEAQQKLRAALGSAGAAPARWLFVSSTGVYAQAGGETVDEDSPTEPQRFNGRRLLEGEAFAAGAAPVASSVRFGGIYGPGRNRLIQTVRRGGACRADPPLYTNRIHRDDCAGVLRHLLRLPQPAPLYLGVDCEPAPQCEVMDWLAERLGVARPPRAATGDGPTRASRRCSNARLLASGYEFLHASYRSGYAALLEAEAC